jgi:hypothetical protein
MAATGPEPPIGIHGTGPFLHAPGASTEAPVGRCPAADALQARGHDPPWAESHALRGPPPPASSDLS